MEILAPFGKLRCGFCHTIGFVAVTTPNLPFDLQLLYPTLSHPIHRSTRGIRLRARPSSEGLSSPYRRRKDPLTAQGLSVATVMWGQLLPSEIQQHTLCVLHLRKLCAVLISHLLNPESCRNDRCGRVRAARWRVTLSRERSDIGRTSAYVWNGARRLRVRRKSQDRCAKNGLFDEGVRQKEVRIREMSGCQTSLVASFPFVMGCHG